ncbi:MAG: hypothetical protein AW07_04234 [Candidatus Accumulibacter sp. SK-11]|nr:MAG: hypothetical protein AW07_04234 [Candidatus Accumulibacter sp. SK-11]
MAPRHFLYGEDAALAAGEEVGHLLHDRWLADHQVVRQQHGKGLAPHQALGTEDGVTETESPWLANVDAIHVIRLDRMDDSHQLVLSRRGELRLEFVGGVEVVLDRALVAAGDEDHLANPGCVGFLDRILDQRLVHHSQHFLRAGLGCRQETCAQTGNREDRFLNLFLDFHSFHPPVPTTTILVPRSNRKCDFFPQTGAPCAKSRLRPRPSV